MTARYREHKRGLLWAVTRIGRTARRERVRVQETRRTEREPKGTYRPTECPLCYEHYLRHKTRKAA